MQVLLSVSIPIISGCASSRAVTALHCLHPAQCDTVLDEVCETRTEEQCQEVEEQECITTETEVTSSANYC